MAGVEDGGKSYAGLEGLHHYAMHFIIDYVAYLTEIDGIDDFIVAIVFVAIEVFRLAAVSWSEIMLAYACDDNGRYFIQDQRGGI